MFDVERSMFIFCLLAFSILLLKSCHKKQENYNEKLATKFVGG